MLSEEGIDEGRLTAIRASDDGYEAAFGHGGGGEKTDFALLVLARIASTAVTGFIRVKGVPSITRVGLSWHFP